MIASRRYPFWFLISLAVSLFLFGCSAPIQPAVPIQYPTPGSLASQGPPARLAHFLEPGTPTPFRPLLPTQPGLAIFSYAPASDPGVGQLPAAEPNLPPQAVQPTALPSIPIDSTGIAAPKDYPWAGVSLEPVLNYHGIDLDSRQRVEIIIKPPNRQVNRGKPIKISFLPGRRCEFGDHKGCVYAYKPSYTGNVIIVTIHSGVGGEGQRLRGALEGTGINRAGLSIKQVQNNLQALNGAEVTIRQGGQVVEGLQIGGLARIPARALKRYFRANLSEILGIAADIDDGLAYWVGAPEPILVLETCGWKMPGEPGSADVSDTTGSVYLSIIH